MTDEKKLGGMTRQKRIGSILMMALWRGGWAGLIALGSLLNVSGGGEASASPPPLSIRPIVTTTDTGLRVEWAAPESQLVSRADGTIEIGLPGYSQTSQPGKPLLPFTSVLIAVPVGATPSVRLDLIEETDQPLPGPLALAPVPQGVQRDTADRIIGGGFAPALSLQSTDSHQSESVVLEPAGILRGVRLMRLVFYPARPIGNYPQTRLRLTTHVRVSITFTQQPGDLSSSSASSNPLLVVLRSVVINPEQVQASTLTRQLAPKSQSLNNSKLFLTKIEVSTPGLTAITYAALFASGFPMGNVDPQTLHLAHAGSADEIATEWDGNNNTLFEPGERLLFYAEPRFSRWTSTDIYFLWQDVITPGLRMQNRSAVPAGQLPGIAWADQTIEVNQLYTPDCFCGTLPPGRDGDRWTWDDLKRPGHSTAAYSINVPTVSATQPAMLTLWLIGYTDIPAAALDHRVKVTFNNVLLGNVDWNGQQAITATLRIPAGILRTINTITLTLPGLPGVNIEGAWLDAFSIRYTRGTAHTGNSILFTGQPTAQAYTLTLSSTAGLRAYDVTNPERPIRLAVVTTGQYTSSLSDPPASGSHRYALTTNSGLLFPVSVRPIQSLQTTGVFTGADYVMIAPIGFTSALSNLIALRRSQGLTVAVENVQAVYDVYGDGRPDPSAIRAYLANAYATWTPRPTYVLLIGNGSFDPKRYRVDSPLTFIPPYLADVDPWAGETAADNRYVTVDGVDSLPDMLIGRLPVNTLTETKTVVDKIAQYETNPFPGGWNANVAFVADNADEAGDFAAASEVIAATYVTAPFTPQRIYYTPPTPTIATIQQAVLNAFDTGALIIQYTGHSSWQQWAAERFFHLDDLPALHNDRRWPIVIEMTCFTGAFQRPEPTLDAGLLTLKNAGAVATWGATGLGVGTGHSSLDAGFFRAVFTDTVSTIGQATLAGKVSLATAGQNLDLLDTFTLLGDPAMRIDRAIIPWISRTYLPIVFKK
jgi:hypothetical protein